MKLGHLGVELHGLWGEQHPPGSMDWAEAWLGKAGLRDAEEGVGGWGGKVKEGRVVPGE